MNPIIWFSIIGASTLIAFLPCIILHKSHKARKKQEHKQLECEAFVVSEYYNRIEQAALDILEAHEPVDQTVILWWGLDGLKLNEDGAMERVSRKKKPAESVFYQPCQFIQPIQASVFSADQMQCTRAQIDALMAQNTALQIQAWQSAQITNLVQQCCVQYPIQYPSYYYGGCCRIN